MAISPAIHFRVLSKQDANAIACWRYPDDYRVYNTSADTTTIDSLLNTDNRYHAIVAANDDLIGYFCVGEDARVPGWTYDDAPARATIAAWNQRSIRLCERAGFHRIATFKAEPPAFGEYVVLLRAGI